MCSRRNTRERVVVERGEIDAVDRDRAGIGPLEPGDEVEQRRLADARLADDRDELAARDVERQAAEDRPRRRTRERLGYVPEFHHARIPPDLPTGSSLSRVSTAPGAAMPGADGRRYAFSGMKRSATPLLQ